MSNSVFGDDDFMPWYVSINVIAAFLGISAGIITLIIIHNMNSNTGHMYLLWYMSFWQLCTDIFILTTNLSRGFDWRIVSESIEIPTGIASSIVSNWMIYSAWHVVMYRKSFNVFSNLHWIWLTSLLPGLAADIVYWMGVAENDTGLMGIAIVDINNNIRIISVGINFLLMIIIIIKILRITPKKLVTKQSLKDAAILTLAQRMILYPIAQCLSRSGYGWYEIQYGPYRDDDSLSEEKKGCLMYLAVVTPLASISYLCILIMMQPKAYIHFKALMCCRTVEEVEIEYMQGQKSASASTPRNRLTLASVAETNSTGDDGSVAPSYAHSQYSGIQWFSNRPSHQEPSMFRPTNLSVGLVREQHLSEAEISVTSAATRNTQNTKNSSRPLRSFIGITPFFKKTTTHVDRSSSTDRSKGKVGEEGGRISDRMSEELARVLPNEDHWQVVCRYSMMQTDEELIGILDEDDENGDVDLLAAAAARAQQEQDLARSTQVQLSIADSNSLHDVVGGGSSISGNSAPHSTISTDFHRNIFMGNNDGLLSNRSSAVSVATSTNTRLTSANTPSNSISRLSFSIGGGYSRNNYWEQGGVSNRPSEMELNATDTTITTNALHQASNQEQK